MNTEIRFLLAIALMLAVLIGTNFIFPPVVPEEALGPDSLGASSGEVVGGRTGGPVEAEVPTLPDNTAGDASRAPTLTAAVTPEDPEAGPATRERRVTVEGPLYDYEFSSYGARMTGAVMTQFQSLRHDGLVDLVPRGADGFFAQKIVIGSDTVDLSRAPFQVEPESGLRLNADGGERTLRFVYEDPTSPFRVEIEYSFVPDEYTVGVSGRVVGAERPLLVTDLGEGLEFSEADSVGESRAMAYVRNHLSEGIKSTVLSAAEPTLVEGPLVWAAYRSKFFVLAMLAGEADESLDDASYLSGLLVRDSPLEGRVRVGAAQTLGRDGAFAYRLFMGPQEYALLSTLGQGMEEVNPYGWKFFRPIVRPFVSVIMAILVFLHTKLSIGYGWILIIMGVMMRVVLFPLNHKAMKAQLRNMAVQPLLQEIQKKYKDQPEKLQKEMMKLYKEHGFNPVAGCLPMLLPWPMLIALFFVFQNTIELRGVPFLWLPDLSAPDPLYLLPVFLGISMFLMQWVSLRSLDQPNPQMKMMMWMMPIMMLFIFFRLASGLNLYYATANLATIPQQMWIANERKRMKGKPPPKIKNSD